MERILKLRQDKARLDPARNMVAGTIPVLLLMSCLRAGRRGPMPGCGPVSRYSKPG